MIDALWRGYVRFLWCGLWLARPFRKPEDRSCDIPQPRLYEWNAHHECLLCGLTGWSRFIEWEDGVTTVECPFCHFEDEVAR